jgi:acyl carrier protein
MSAVPELDGSALDRLEPGLRAIVARLADASAELARRRGGRAAHAVGVGARGTLRVHASLDLPEHGFFTPGRAFPALLRHSNARGFDDDAVLDGRGAALRLLASPDPLDALLDLVLVTGQRFFMPHAAAFLRWAAGDAATRGEMLRESPRAGRALGELIRDPSSYAAIHYHSQTVYRFVGRDRREWLARYRLRPPEQPADGGSVGPAELRLPLDYVPRRQGDARATTYLRDDFRRRVADGGVRYLLELQLHPLPAAPDAREEVLDHTRAWPAEAFPWRDVGLLLLDGLVPATGPEDPASVNQARAIAYAFSARARAGEPLPVRTDAARPLPLRDAITETVRALRAESAPSARPALDRIVSALEASPLRGHPDALAEVVAGLRALGPAGPPEVAPGEIAGMARRFAADSPRAAAGDAAALVRVLDAYEPRALELLAWGGVLRCELFADHDELRRYFATVPSVLPAETHLPAAARLDDDAYLVVTRFASLTPDGQRALLSEYASTVRRRGGGWAYQSVIETDYRETAAVDGAVEAYLHSPLGGADLAHRLLLARLGGLLVAVWSASLDRAAPRLPSTGRPSAAPRVCVIGAGPAGLVAARELERRGWRATVLERAEHVGGKCASIEIDGRAYDLGGHLCGASYSTIRALADELGCAIESATPSYELDLARGALPSSAARTDPGALRAYTSERRECFPGIQAVGLHAAGRALAEPVAAWLTAPEHRALAAMALPYTGSGYGYVTDRELPALYLAKWAEMTGVLGDAGAAAERWTIAGGFERLWRRVADALSDVRLDQRVEAVERDGAAVRVRTAAGVEIFDALVVACPPDAALGFLDASPGERDLLGRVRQLEYWTTVATVTGLPRLGFYLVRQRAEDAASAGCPVAFHHRYAASDVYLFYSYGRPGFDGDEIERRIRGDVAQAGGRVEAVHLQRRWAFLPHVGPADVADGFYTRLEALQGEHRTYWVGGLAGFELVECAAAQAADVVARLIAPPSGAAVTLATTAPVRVAALPARAGPMVAGALDAGTLRAWLVERVAARLSVPTAEVDPSLPFESYDLESLQIARLIADMSEWLGWQIPPSLLFEYPTIDDVAEHLAVALA